MKPNEHKLKKEKEKERLKLLESYSRTRVSTAEFYLTIEEQEILILYKLSHTISGILNLNKHNI